MGSSDDKRRREIEEWDLDALFYEKEKEVEEAESKNALAKAKYQARNRVSSDSYEVKKNISRRSPSQEEVDLPAMDDFMKENAQENGASSGVHLTSLEPEAAFEKAALIQPEPSFEVPAAPAAPEMPSEDAPLQGTDGATKPGFDAYNGPYDYDYDAQDTTYQPEAPLQNPVSPEPAAAVNPETPGQEGRKEPKRSSGSGKVSRKNAEENRQKREMARRLEEEEEEEEKAARKKQWILYGSLGAVILILLALIVVLLLTENTNPGKGESSVQSMPVSESSVKQDLQTLSGVVTRIDQESGTFLVYNAQTRVEKSFTVSAQAAQSVGFSSLKVGDIIDLTYDAQNSNAPTKIVAAGKKTVLKDIDNVNLSQVSQISYKDQIYKLDDQTVILYQGKPYDKEKVTKTTVFDAEVVGDHIYTIRISAAAGTFIMENLKDYEGATVELVPAGADKIELKITDTTLKTEVPEGSLEVTVTLDGEKVYTGKSFVTAGQDNKLRLPNLEAKKGKVVFDCTVPEGVNVIVTVDGRTYATGQEIDFEYGDYKATFKADGYTEVNTEFKVSQPYQQVSASLKKQMVKVVVSSVPAGATLYINGVYENSIGSSGLSLELDFGQYDLTAYLEGYEAQYRNLNLDKDSGTVEVIFYMVELPKEESSESSAPVEESSVAPVESQPVESQPVESQPAESQPVESQPVESQPVESQPVESQPVESQPVESQPVEETPSEPETQTPEESPSNEETQQQEQTGE
ncbi:MAG: PEGA domain-containing protein [Firmicutes bacterium]|nr:PEGA domain-containing protein [Bacillota bacterium]